MCQFHSPADVRVLVACGNIRGFYQNFWSQIATSLGGNGGKAVIFYQGLTNLEDIICPPDESIPFPSLEAVVINHDTDTPEYGLPSFLEALSEREVKKARPLLIFVGFPHDRLQYFALTHKQSVIALGQDSLSRVGELIATRAQATA